MSLGIVIVQLHQLSMHALVSSFVILYFLLLILLLLAWASGLGHNTCCIAELYHHPYFLLIVTVTYRLDKLKDKRFSLAPGCGLRLKLHSWWQCSFFAPVINYAMLEIVVRTLQRTGKFSGMNFIPRLICSSVLLFFCLSFHSLMKKQFNRVVVAHAFSPSTQEAGRSLRLSSVWSMKWFLGQSGLQGKSLSQKKEQKQKSKTICFILSWTC